MLYMKSKSGTLSTPENLIYVDGDIEFCSNILERCSSTSNSIARYFYDIYNSINDSSTPLANSESAYMQTPTKVKFHNLFDNINKNILPSEQSTQITEKSKISDDTNTNYSSGSHFKPRCSSPELMAEYQKTNPSQIEIPKIYKGFQRSRDFKIFNQALIFKSDNTKSTQGSIRNMKQPDFANHNDGSTKVYKAVNNEKKKISVFRDNFTKR